MHMLYVFCRPTYPFLLYVCVWA